jgi:glycosyltransferase involved in cell wall biosynthesis
VKIWFPTIRTKSGSDVYVERLASLLNKAGHEPLVSWFSHAFEFAPSLLKVVKPPMGTDVIHANSWNAFAFAGKGCPLVTTVHHCVRGMGYPEWKSRAQMLYHEQWISRLEERSFQASSEVVAVSESTAHDLGAWFGVHAKVINNWIDTELFRPRIRREEGAPRVLFVGNLSRRKGGDLLPALRKKLDDAVELHVVGGRRGSPSSFPNMGRNTKFWAAIGMEQLLHLYQQCDVMVCLSRHEGFGYAALEAMACGRPVVAFDVSGIRDVVEAGVTGELRICEDIDGVADTCHRLINNPTLAETMGQAGRQRAIELFSTARATEEYSRLYRELLVERQVRS